MAGAAKGVGTDCGKLLGKLDDYIEEDRVRWIEEGQGAWDFFAKKLPLSAGKLVGIK